MVPHALHHRGGDEAGLPLPLPHPDVAEPEVAPHLRLPRRGVGHQEVELVRHGHLPPEGVLLVDPPRQERLDAPAGGFFQGRGPGEALSMVVGGGGGG